MDAVSTEARVQIHFRNGNCGCEIQEPPDHAVYRVIGTPDSRERAQKIAKSR